MNWILLSFKFFLTACFVVLGIFFLRPTEKVLWQSCQPIAIYYPSDIKYCASVVEGGFSYNFYTHKLKRGTFLFITSELEKVRTGYNVEYQFQTENINNEAETPQLESIWNESGVEIIEPTGHKIFVPASFYTGFKPK